MPGTPEVEELCSAIEQSARKLGVAYSRDKVWPILTAYGDAFGHDATVVAFRVATSMRQAGELDCRFMTHPKEREPYAVALSNGITPETDHPVGDLLADIQERCPVDSYGIDFGVVGGFKKVYGFFTPETLQKVSTFADMPSMPRSLAANADFLARHGVADRVNVIGIDYGHRTVNVYLGAPAECYEPETIRSMLRELGMAEPSEQLLKLGEKSFGLYVTLNWESSKIERICYAVTTTDLATLPIPVEPEIVRFAQSIPYGGAERKFVYGIALAAEGEYHKIEAHLKWQAGVMDYI
ncbi:aromatic prenyltransferase [Actinacidiphila paucisporea]|uniref:Aromatic prenyltransferase Orf2 n=1 Tax=Actinacidiphila paucisporea TaxID=310782 RepID=A0A1M7Q7Q0_9ACTN|nr:aromatic prenyltransferase [Actinacidiphila paucisporea]SHN26497.1 Aromatic prenyltransferase Orf2 [Actinacidiphila paucisporea]